MVEAADARASAISCLCESSGTDASPLAGGCPYRFGILRRKRKLVGSAASPDDELVFETAINGSATVIITHTVRDLSQAGPAFGIEAVRPAEALRRIRAWVPEPIR